MTNTVQSTNDKERALLEEFEAFEERWYNANICETNEILKELLKENHI